jgi:hypothetical protein
MIVRLSKYYLGDQTVEDEMGRAYGTYGEKTNVYWVLMGTAG